MASDERLSRRRLLRTGLISAACVTMWPAAGRAADAPLLDPGDPAAVKLKYTEDAAKTKGVPAGSTCANCALYQGSYSSRQGPCQLFPGKQVRATGWCSSWTAQI